MTMLGEPTPPEAVRQFPAPRRVLETLLGVPFTDGNRVDVLRNGEQTFPALLTAIDGSNHSIDLLWFSWHDGDIGAKVAAALAERASSGVRVRVLLDGYGARHTGRGHLREMRRAGCEVVFYRPIPSVRPTVWNLRTHRRVLICDETLAITGGTGIADEWTGDGRHPGQWRETAFRVRGPAVAGLRSAFAGPWLQAQIRLGQNGPASAPDRFPQLDEEGSSAVQALRPSSGPGWNDAMLAAAVLLQIARTQLRITTPYVRLPIWLRSRLCDTARRGVDVQLLVSGPHVERPSVHLQGQRDYQPLLDAGVQIWQYQPSLMHAKVLTVDGELAMVGTANLDIRSLALNEQVTLLVQDPAVTAELDADFDEDLANSARITRTEWRSRPVTHRALEAASDLVGRPLRGWGGAGLTGRRTGWWPAPHWGGAATDEGVRRLGSVVAPGRG